MNSPPQARDWDRGYGLFITDNLELAGLRNGAQGNTIKVHMVRNIQGEHDGLGNVFGHQGFLNSFIHFCSHLS